MDESESQDAHVDPQHPPALSSERRARQRELLERILVNRVVLLRHIEKLARITKKSDREVRLPHGELMERVVEQGLDDLGDVEVALLIWNPIALTCLNDRISRRFPPAWLDAMSRDGAKLLAENDLDSSAFLGVALRGEGPMRA